MEDIDIWRSAHQLIKTHGELAAEFAAAKVNEMQRASDGEGVTAWIAIMLAIRELTRETPQDGESRH